MTGKFFRLIFFLLVCSRAYGQTTDVSIVAQAQSTGGMAVSQVQIFEDFQYVITIINNSISTFG